MTRAGWNALRRAAFFPLACSSYLVVAAALAHLIGTLPGSGNDSGQQVFSLMSTSLSALAATLMASRIAPRWPVRVGLGTALVLALLALGLNAVIYYADEAKTVEYAPAVFSLLGGLAALPIIRRWRR